MNPSRFHEYKGAIHMHSTYSDGTKTFPEIIQIGKSCGLDFLMFTDHMTLKPLEDGFAGWHDSLLVLIGYEINDAQNKNHYLAFGLDKILPYDLSARDYVSKVKQQGGLGILAHPDEIRNKLPRFPPYPWTEWDADNFDGIEIWNQMSEWMESLTKYNRLLQLIHPRKSLKGPTDRILAFWDKKAQKRKVLAVGGVDAHGHKYRLGLLPLTIFPYEVQFRTIRTHILSDQPLSKDSKTAKSQVLSALRDCRVFISNIRWGETDGFTFTAENSNSQVTIGGVIEFDKSVKLQVKLPGRCQLRLVKNGLVAIEEKTGRLEYVSYTPGIFRVEALRKGKGWIYSNHIYVLEPDRIASFK
jgi:hypothetical protein